MRRGPSLRFRAAYAVRPSTFRVEVGEALTMAEGGALLVDVRRDEGDDPLLPGAVRITPDQIPGRLPTFPRDQPIVLACT